MNRFTGLIAAGMVLAATASAFAASTAPASGTTAAPAAVAAPMPKAMHRHAVTPKTDVKAIQTALNSNGEKVAVDGVWGRKTSDALKDFQHKQGIKPTGRADQATLGALKVPAKS